MPMAFPTTPRILFALLLAALAATGGAGVANVLVVNKCPFPVWPAATPVGGGTKLNPGDRWGFQVPAGTRGMRVWARTDCSFAAGDSGTCGTGDCAGALCCVLSGKPPMTLAEFSVGSDTESGGNVDFFDISVEDGFNVPMDFYSSTYAGGEVPVSCRDPSCPDASHRGEPPKVRSCRGNSDYTVVFCP